MISEIIGVFVNLYVGIATWATGFFVSFTAWLHGFLYHLSHFIIYALLIAFQTIILSIIYIANAAVLLLPACNFETIDLSSFNSVAPSLQEPFTKFICWALPIQALSYMLLCSINLILAYFSISWALRWLKVIK